MQVSVTETLLDRDSHTSNGDHCSGRYATYCNELLLPMFLNVFLVMEIMEGKMVCHLFCPLFTHHHWLNLNSGSNVHELKNIM